MIPFFRKMRYRLAQDNQFFKYSRYAIGEIVLVVVGILIALYINNWNEERKERERFNLTLVEIEKELVANINSARSSIEHYANVDSLLLKILIDTLKMEDYVGRSRRRLVREPFFYSFAEIKDESFRKLEPTPGLSPEQETILKDLNDLNGDVKSYIDESRGYMMDRFMEYIDTLKKYKWFKDLAFNKINDEVVHYYLENPEFFNNATIYSNVVMDYCTGLDRYERKAVAVYTMIHKFLEESRIDHSDSLLFQYKVDDYKHYLGNYESTWCSDEYFVHSDSIVISRENEKLIFTDFRPDGTNFRSEIIPVDKYLFRISAGFCHLSLDEHGQVEKIRLSSSIGIVLSMEKNR